MTGHPIKPEVDWDAIKRRAIAGESFRSIANDPDITVTNVAISQRARSEGWLTPSELRARQPKRTVQKGKPGRQPATPSAETIALVADTSTVRALASVKTWRTPEAAAQIVEEVRLGHSLTVAALALGMTRQKLDDWLSDDLELQAIVRQARAEVLGRQERNIIAAGDRGQFQASQWLLERAAETREAYAAKQDGAGRPMVAIQLNVDRPHREPHQVVVIDDGKSGE